MLAFGGEEWNGSRKVMRIKCLVLNMEQEMS